MEHLTLPKSCSVKKLIQIPYKCKVTYDGGDFLTYPQRANLRWAVSTDQMHDTVLFSKLAASMGRDEIEAGLQTWLYFGLIAEFLGRYISSDQLYRQTDKSSASTYVLCSAGLPSAIEKWISDVKTRGKCTKEAYSRALDCMRLVFENIRCLKPNISEYATLLLASLGELFSSAIREAFKDAPLAAHLGLPTITWIHLVNQSFWSKLMQTSGFCPSQQKVTLDTTIRVHSLYYIAHLAQPESIYGHKHCNEIVCHAQQDKAGARSHYRTLHVSEECSCDFIEAQGAADILQSGYIPLMQISVGASLVNTRLEMKSSRDFPRYVALSHVWADGLGNWRANALPKCQLRALHTIVRKLGSSLHLTDDEELLLWCDTICCPVEPFAKNLALAEMKRTYSEATAVLVLERSVRQFRHGDFDYNELIFRILTAGWSRRLWTLQEAMLGLAGTRLWFQCQDKAVNILPMLNFILQENRGDLFQRFLGADLILRTGEWFTFCDDNPAKVTDLRLLSETLQNRSVSVEADEPILIGNLLNLDSVKLLKVHSASSRMQTLWTLMMEATNGIPSSLIFWIGPRLQLPGFRWAPSTLLHNCVDNFPMNMYQTVDGMCEITTQGLRLKFPGYIFSLANRSGLLRAAGRDLMSRSDFDFIYVRSSDRTWLSLTSAVTDSNQKHTSLDSPSFSNAIIEPNTRLILAREQTSLLGPHTEASKMNFRGLLAKEVAKEGDTRLVRSLFHVSVHFAEAPLARVLDAAITCAEKVLEMDTARVLSDDNRCTFATDIDDARKKMANLQTEVDEIVDKLDKDFLEYLANAGRKLALVKQVYHFVLCVHGILGERMPETQEWCVD